MAGICDWLDVCLRLGHDAAAVAIMRAGPIEPALADTTRREAKDQPTGEAPGEVERDPYPVDDLQIARRLLMELFPPLSPACGRWSLVRWSGAWWYYDREACLWTTVEEERLAAVILGHMAGATMWGVTEGTDDAGSATRQWVRRPMHITPNRVNRLLFALRTDASIDGEAMPMWLSPSHDDQGQPGFDEAARIVKRVVTPGTGVGADQVIPTRSGLLDLRALRRREVKILRTSERYFARGCLRFTIDRGVLEEAMGDLDAQDRIWARLCPRWIRFLDEISLGEAAFSQCLQQWFGYVFTPTNWLGRNLILVGLSGSGKTTTYSVLAEMLGPELCCISSINRLEDRWEYARFLGRNLIVFGDVVMGRYTDAGAVKEAILNLVDPEKRHRIEWKGVKEIPDRPLYCKMILGMNRLPKITDADGAMSRRFVFLPFRRVALRADRTLLRQFRAEMQGIFHWSLVGLQALLESGELTVPASAEARAAEFRRLNSSVRAFVDSECVIEDGAEVESVAMYAAYVQWCQREGVAQVATASGFGEELQAFVPGLDRTQRRLGQRRVYVRRGIRLRELTDDDLLTSSDEPPF